MSKYVQEQQDALESIKDAGVQLDFELYTNTKDTDPNADPWDKTKSTENVKLWCVIFPVDNAPSKLKEMFFKEGSMIAEEYRYILAAGEGRTKHPKGGDKILKPEGGKDGVVRGCSALTVDGGGAIIYEMVVKV